MLAIVLCAACVTWPEGFLVASAAFASATAVMLAIPREARHRFVVRVAECLLWLSVIVLFGAILLG
jgi:hypothetical protein